MKNSLLFQIQVNSSFKIEKYFLKWKLLQPLSNGDKLYEVKSETEYIQSLFLNHDELISYSTVIKSKL